jgi:hypothetical protein
MSLTAKRARGALKGMEKPEIHVETDEVKQPVTPRKKKKTKKSGGDEIESGTDVPTWVNGGS